MEENKTILTDYFMLDLMWTAYSVEITKAEWKGMV